MIQFNNKEISLINFGVKAIQSVYRGTVLIWESITSCFNSGAWLGEKPWSGTDGWRGNTK